MSSNSKIGRPSKFEDVDKCYWKFLCENGFTNLQISQKIGVHESTIYNWKKEHSDFFESLKDWRAIADDGVEASLFQRAQGYSVEEVRLFQDKRGNIVEHTVIKHYPPDPTSMIFWLKNRKSSEWKDKQEIDQTVKFGTIDISSDDKGL